MEMESATAVIAPSVQLETSSCKRNDSIENNESMAIETPTSIAAANNNVLPYSEPSASSQSVYDLSLWKFDDTIASTSNDSSNTLPLINRHDDRSNIDMTVDIIVPVHNASSTIRETIASAMNQIWLTDETSLSSSYQPNITIHVCCYNDASTDDSWCILEELYDMYSTKCTNQQQKSTTSTDSTSTNDYVSPRGRSYPIPTQLWISSSPPNSIARGPGYARNHAVQMRDTIITPQDTKRATRTTRNEHHFICWLDSDDIMHPTRIYYQAHTMMQLQPSERLRTLLGTNFERFIVTGDHIDSETITPHYTKWANELSHERLYLERFREVTIIQPTWMMCRYRYTHVLHGYLVCPIVEELESIHRPVRGKKGIEVDNIITTDDSSSSIVAQDMEQSFSEWIRNVNDFSVSGVKPWRLVHTELETLSTIRVAEDLRFFHEHLYRDGLLRRTSLTSSTPLVSYRHRPGISQSALTSRKLLLALRVTAFERMILFHKSHTHIQKDAIWNDKFIIWGAGRDGKDFFKALSSQARERVYCFVDVDDAKIARGFYNYFNPTSTNVPKQQRTAMMIPIVHFSLAVQDPCRRSQLYDSWKMNIDINSHDQSIQPYFGRIVKNQESVTNDDTSNSKTVLPPAKRIKVNPNYTGEKVDPGTKSLAVSLLPNLPVVVCVAMYRTNGALERNVDLIDRVEGKDLWYFS